MKSIIPEEDFITMERKVTQQELRKKVRREKEQQEATFALMEEVRKKNESRDLEAEARWRNSLTF